MTNEQRLSSLNKAIEEQKNAVIKAKTIIEESEKAIKENVEELCKKYEDIKAFVDENDSPKDSPEFLNALLAFMEKKSNEINDQIEKDFDQIDKIVSSWSETNEQA